MFRRLLRSLRRRREPEQIVIRRDRDDLPEPPPFDPDMRLIGDMEKPQRPIQRDKDDTDR